MPPPAAKKAKFNSRTKEFFQKQARIQRNKQRQCDVGDKGYFVTYNSKEKDAIREIYRLLNEYRKPAEEEEEEIKKEEDEDDDILNQLNNAIDNSKKETKAKAKIFQALESAQKGNVFIRAELKEFYELIVTIVKDLAATKAKKTRLINRIVPIEAVCKANLEDIINTAGELFDKHFLKEPHTFAINFNRKLNKNIERDEVISQLADLIYKKNIKNKVNLKEPERTVIVEIQKGHCMLGVVPDYIKLKKYNLLSLAKTESSVAEDEAQSASSQEIPKDEEKEIKE